MLRQTGGEVQHDINRSDPVVQFLSRAGSSIVAKKQIDDVYELLKNKLGVLLPAKTIDEGTVREIVYPAVKTYRIVPNQLPGYIGADNTNHEMWSVNFTITTT